MGEIEEVENGYMLELLLTGGTLIGLIFIGTIYFQHSSENMSIKEYEYHRTNKTNFSHIHYPPNLHDM